MWATYDWWIDPECAIDLSHPRDVVVARLAGVGGRRQVSSGARVPVHPARPRNAREAGRGRRRGDVFVVRGRAGVWGGDDAATAGPATAVGDEDDGEDGEDEADDDAEDDRQQREEFLAFIGWQTENMVWAQVMYNQVGSSLLHHANLSDMI